MTLALRDEYSFISSCGEGLCGGVEACDGLLAAVMACLGGFGGLVSARRSLSGGLCEELVVQESTASLPARLELSSDLSTMDSDLGVISEGLTTMFFSQILGWRAACGCGSAVSFGSAV